MSGGEESKVGKAFFEAFTRRVIEYNESHYAKQLEQLKTADAILTDGDATTTRAGFNRCGNCRYPYPHKGTARSCRQCQAPKCTSSWCPDYDQCVGCGEAFLCKRCVLLYNCHVDFCKQTYCNDCVKRCRFCKSICCIEHNLTCPDCPNEICSKCKTHFCRKLKMKKTIVEDEDEMIHQKLKRTKVTFSKKKKI